MAQSVENDNMDQSHEYMREVESGVPETSEHSLPNLLNQLIIVALTEADLVYTQQGKNGKIYP